MRFFVRDLLVYTFFQSLDLKVQCIIEVFSTCFVKGKMEVIFVCVYVSEGCCAMFQRKYQDSRGTNAAFLTVWD